VTINQKLPKIHQNRIYLTNPIGNIADFSGNPRKAIRKFGRLIPVVEDLKEARQKFPGLRLL
jgi:hypothetical protein